MTKFIDYLNMKKCGFFELIIALYPILAGYAYGMVHLSDLVLLLLCCMAYSKTRKLQQYKHFKMLAVFIVLHEVVVWVGFTNMPTYMINNTLSTIIYVLCVSIIVPAINYDRYCRSIVLVAIIASLGIAYHFAVIRTGHSVSPIPLPFLPEPPATSRFFEIGDRPVSFFWEPAGYANFMLVPLMLFLINKEYLMLVASLFFMFLSTSSTAIMLSLIMVGIYIVTSTKSNIFIRVLFGVLMAAMVLFLLSSDMFSYGVEKIENTEVETTSRLYNGPELFRNMPFIHFITGIPAANITDYYLHTSFIKNASLLVKEDSVFMPAFYMILAKFGIVGLLIYLYTIIKPALDCRDVWPYVGVVIIALFFAGNSLTNVYTTEMIFLYTYLLHKKRPQDGFKN